MTGFQIDKEDYTFRLTLDLAETKIEMSLTTKKKKFRTTMILRDFQQLKELDNMRLIAQKLCDAQETMVANLDSGLVTFHFEEVFTFKEGLKRPTNFIEKSKESFQLKELVEIKKSEWEEL